jgi:hypothetical protein
MIITGVITIIGIRIALTGSSRPIRRHPIAFTTERQRHKEIIN